MVTAEDAVPAATHDSTHPQVALELDAVTASYPGGGQVLTDVSLKVMRGRVHGLLGANGAGKSTVLRTISGMIEHTGVIRFDGRELVGSPTQRARRGIAHVPEGRQVFGSLTVRENLLLSRTAAGASSDGSDMDEVVAIFPELGKLMGRSGAWLSGGEQQMVAIGRAMMAQPDFILFDEPTMGLAPVVVDRLFGFFERLCDSEQTVLVAEENVSFAVAVSDHCHILQAGRITWEGSSLSIDQDVDVQDLLLG